MSLGSLSLKMMGLAGKKVLKMVENNATNPMQVQNELLMSLINENKDTQFGKEHHFCDIKNLDDYRKYVPTMEYEDYVPYIQKIADGKKNILTSSEVIHFNRTSGTLGKEKMIPLTEKQLNIFAKYNALMSNAFLLRDLKGKWTKGKGLNLSEGSYTILPSGISYGSASSITVVRLNKMGPFKNLMGNIYTSPIEARIPSSNTLTRYIHARFALQEKNITYIISTFSSNVLEILRYIKHNWKMLVDDIRNGTINEESKLKDDVKNSLLKKIKKMPKRANELEEIFKQGLDDRWVLKIWPNLTYLQCAAGATFQPYTNKLLKHYLGKDFNIVYMGTSASEGYFSTTFKVNEKNSILVPNCCFMEFLDTSKDDNNYLTMDKLEIGKQYELVITNLSGLYRYRMKDIIEVTGMYKNSPLVQFVGRSGFAINLFGEKTSEMAIRNAVELTEKELNIEILEDAIYANVDSSPSRYEFVLEFESNNLSVSKENIREALEKNLKISNEDITEEFDNHHLDHIKVIILQEQTNLLYRDLMIMKGVNASQLKPVKIIKDEFQKKFFFGLEDKEIK